MTGPGLHDDMVPYARALRIVTGAARRLAPETLPLERALGRYLADPVKARWDLPRFEQSAMDGFAVRTEDLRAAALGRPVALALVGEMPAGGGRRLRIETGQTVKVFTGGRLPAGADAVVLQEFVDSDDKAATFSAAPAAGANVRRVGEEVRHGEALLPVGTRVTPPVIGLLATMGRTEATVVRAPMVTIVTIGDELVAPGHSLDAGQVADANAPALRAALRALGVARVRSRRIRDRIGVLERTLAKALEASDLVLTVGGASVGDHDHVAGALSLLGVTDLFHRVAVKPGKPCIFGVARSGVPVCGLPGNPVSALVSFHQLVKPLVRVMMGAADPFPRAVPVRLQEERHKTPGRAHWLRGRLVATETDLAAELVEAQGSHMLSGLAAADLLAELPAASDLVPADAVVRAWLLDWTT